MGGKGEEEEPDRWKAKMEDSPPLLTFGTLFTVYLFILTIFSNM